MLFWTRTNRKVSSSAKSVQVLDILGGLSSSLNLPTHGCWSSFFFTFNLSLFCLVLPPYRKKNDVLTPPLVCDKNVLECPVLMWTLLSLPLRSPHRAVTPRHARLHLDSQQRRTSSRPRRNFLHMYFSMIQLPKYVVL